MDKLLFRRKLAFGFRSDLSYDDISSLDYGSDPDNTVLIQILELIHRNSRDIIRRLFRPEFRISHLYLIFFDLDRGELIIFHEPLGYHDRIFIVISFPWHERYSQILSQRHLAFDGTWSLCDKISLLQFFA